MFIADLRNNIIHDAMNSKYECKIKEIPQDQMKKVYTKQSVDRMCSGDHTPTFMGCKWCLPELYTFDMTQIFH